MPALLPSPRADLPLQLTSFVGREREIAAVRQMLATSRLLTLTGAGGSGKTRLALEVAAQVAEEYPDGLAWVELAALADPDLLPQHIAATLGIREEGGRSAVEALVHALGKRSLLLVLDNCEHLIDACAALADALLRGCPGLKILATSREALGVAGERAWLVPPLSLPDPGAADEPQQLADFEAVQLFVQRAQDVLPSFALTHQNAAAVAQICRRLDGIPLAIELAAARVKVLSPEQIAQRLDNAFALLTSGSRTALPRHRTLRATIDWSYQLLSQAEQLLLRRLSVFAGGLTLEAAEAVCADERLEVWEVLDLLARLVDRSLVVMREQEGAARYHLLETVRQFARERLEERGGAEAVRRRHAEFFLAFAEAAEPHLYLGGADPLWLSRVEAEIGNLRAAAEWFEADPQGAESALALAVAVHWRWYRRGHFLEMRQWLDRVLARGQQAAALRRAQALVALGYGAFTQGDVTASLVAASSAVELLRSLDDPQSLAFALANIGCATVALGDHDSGEALMQEAVALGRSLNPVALVAPLSWAAYVADLRGEYERAMSLHEEAFSLAIQLGLRYVAGQIAIGQTQSAFALGTESRAIHYIRETLELARETRDPGTMIHALEVLAAVEAARSERAERLLAIAEAFRERTGIRLRPFPSVNEHTEAVRRRLGAAAFAAAVARERTLGFEQAVDYALAVARESADSSPAPASPTAAPPVTHPQPPSAPSAAARPPAGAASVRDSALAALRVLALGPLEIYREGERLPADAWRYAKPKELLLYLLSYPEGRTKEQIGLVFWPDASTAQVKNSFHVTLHHVRKALGRSEWIVAENERYRLSPQIEVEFDAARFERQISEALRQVRTRAGSVAQLRAALDLYRGDFLEEEPVGDWHLEMRDHLRRLYVEGLLALGELLMQAELWAEAAEVYQQIVRREDLHEEAHRRLILCLARSGERARALRHYERLVVLLREELDTAPEEETTEVYERLRQAQPV